MAPIRLIAFRRLSRDSIKRRGSPIDLTSSNQAGVTQNNCGESFWCMIRFIGIYALICLLIAFLHERLQRETAHVKKDISLL